MCFRQFFIFVLCALNLRLIVAENILFMGPFPAPSHWMWLEHFQRGLLDRGHTVTSVTNHPTKRPHENLTELIINPMFNISYYFPKENLFKMRYVSDFNNLQMWWHIGLLTSEHALNDVKVKRLINSKVHKFDLVILEQFFHESFLLFGHKFNCPVVTLGTMGYADNMDHAMGLLTPWSVIPHLLLSYTDQMTFKERVYNVYLSLYDSIMRRWHYLPKMQEMAERHFGNVISGPIPSVRDLANNISLMLINSHRSVDHARPKMPGLIDVGGLHIKPAKKLPPELQDFLDNSSNGVVYFSFGSYVNSNDMPLDKIAMILKAFSKLKQNVLWKFENTTMVHIPDNVMVRNWMPQNDILAHSNVKLFITHGGIFGTQESIYWGVPMLCLPLYGDQHRNSIKSVQGGYARLLKFSELTAENLLSNINTLIKEPKYTSKALEMSKKFRDNPINGLDESMYWIEYVMRHKGAAHLKSYGAYIPLYQYLLLDIIGGVLIVIILCLWLNWKLMKTLYRKLVQTDKNEDMNKKRI